MAAPNACLTAELKALNSAISSFLESLEAKDEDLNNEVVSRNFINVTRSWIADYGLDAVDQWCEEGTKHKHRLIHIAVIKNLGQYITFLGKQGFAIDAQRPSDLCTPVHVGIWYKKKLAVDRLKESGADLTIKNRYGEDCSASYEKLVNSASNLIFLDLEMTYAFYDWAKVAKDQPDIPLNG